MRNASSNEAIRASSWLSIARSRLWISLSWRERVELVALARQVAGAGSCRLAIGFFRSRTSVPW